MENTFRKHNLPVMNLSQLQELFAELILWYDKPYCENINGANEVVGQYMLEVCDGETSKKASVLPIFVVGSTVCKTCNGKKKVPKRDWYDGKLIGSIKCWDCNGGVRPSTMFDNY